MAEINPQLHIPMGIDMIPEIRHERKIIIDLTANGIVNSVKRVNARVVLCCITYTIAYAHGPFQFFTRNKRDHNIRVKTK